MFGTCRQSGGLSAELLWTNANPSTAFGNQTLQLSKSLEIDDICIIDYRYDYTSSKKFRVMIDLKNSDWYGLGESITIGLSITALSGVVYTRYMRILKSAMDKIISANESSNCIPIAIYRAKSKIGWGID